MWYFVSLQEKNVGRDLVGSAADLFHKVYILFNECINKSNNILLMCIYFIFIRFNNSKLKWLNDFLI